MPLYEYRCQACGRAFAERRPIERRDLDVSCPVCSATNVVRLVSSFSAFTAGSEDTTRSLGATSCGGCTLSSCSGCASARSR